MDESTNKIKVWNFRGKNEQSASASVISQRPNFTITYCSALADCEKYSCGHSLLKIWLQKVTKHCKMHVINLKLITEDLAKELSWPKSKARYWKPLASTKYFGLRILRPLVDHWTSESDKTLQNACLKLPRFYGSTNCMPWLLHSQKSMTTSVICQVW